MCILTMAVGYATLIQKLNVEGTARVSSIWSVKITGITSNATGTATDKVAPSYTDTTATFNTNLESPGDKMEYTVTVTNAGTLDAVIDNVTLNADENDSIIYTITGIEDDQELLHGESINFKVTVEFDRGATSMPEDKDASATVIINVVQLRESVNPSGEKKASEILREKAVTEGDGLY